MRRFSTCIMMGVLHRPGRLETSFCPKTSPLPKNLFRGLAIIPAITLAQKDGASASEIAVSGQWLVEALARLPDGALASGVYE
jgi:hypothetical protein